MSCLQYMFITTSQQGGGEDGGGGVSGVTTV